MSCHSSMVLASSFCSWVSSVWSLLILTLQCVWDSLQVSAARRLAVSLVRTDAKDTQLTFQFHQTK